MAQLTKDQILFIDDYLKRNKVKYWDVRMELLDHVASAIEDELKKSISFEQALQNVHLSFGNKKTSKSLNKSRTAWIINESIYADNSGYKKFIGDKQKALQSNLRKMYGQALITFFKTPLLLVTYILLLYILFKANGHIGGEALLKGLASIVSIGVAIPFCFSLFHFIKYGRSIYLSVLSGLTFGLLYGVSSLLFYLPKGFIFGDDKVFSHGYFVVMCAILVPLLFTQTKVFFSYLSKIKKIQSRLA
ncbi:hypothetical protein [Kriegella aquimaris]|uniref:Uncharacterized protein n=1 Tax=Kriegella aquimaris TaxID=192904 RepID=A0A1G9QJK4_9FLAO|nr:hypothetical protein [Kriegella aquimaris]SDM11169.1 hypothetical protein SAMN04488514_10573 [Kriegella aquimaris]